jgi:uncharacterized protein YecE (DUF72 family)
MIWIGTSGYNYPEWKGSFYPETMPAAKMLPYYAARFPTVEINHLLPDAERERSWRSGPADAVALQVHAQGAPPDHARQPAEKLRSAGQRVLPRRGNAADKLGTLLFQLPPN